MGGRRRLLWRASRLDGRRKGQSRSKGGQGSRLEALTTMKKTLLCGLICGAALSLAAAEATWLTSLPEDRGAG